MKLRLTAVFLGVLLTGNFRTVEAQTLTAGQWREDLEFLSSSISTQHPNPFHAVNEDFFLGRVALLNESIPKLQDHEIISWGMIHLLMRFCQPGRPATCQLAEAFNNGSGRQSQPKQARPGKLSSPFIVILS